MLETFLSQCRIRKLLTKKGPKAINEIKVFVGISSKKENAKLLE